jgi:hypothetical protein
VSADVPSVTHEALLLLFRNRPELAPELLRDVLHVALPPYAEARVESADLSELTPAEYRADLVVLLVDDKPVLGIIVEVQLQRDERKALSWPVYVTGVRARFTCGACVLVVTPNESVATWARTPLSLGPGGVWEPLVIGPSAVPVVREVAAAVRDPELAVLSAMAHGGGEPGVAVEIALAALAAAAGLDEDRALLYSDLVRVSLGEAARAAFEDLMANGNYEYQSEFAKTHQARGVAIGRAEGEAASVLKILAARGIPVTEAQRARVLACTDVATLDGFIARAVVVTTAEELFVD